MKPTLKNQFEALKLGKKSNGFSKVIKNNEAIRNELYENSKILEEYYNNPSDLQRLLYIFQDLKINLCECGNPRSWRNFQKGYNKTCGTEKCITRENNRSHKTFCREKYGVDYYFQTKDFKDKTKEGFIKKYGTDNPFNLEEIKKKIRQTNKERFGETNWLKVKNNREKISQSLTEKNKEMRLDKIKEKNIPIDIDFFSTSDVIINCKICGKITKFSTSFFNKRISIGENPCLNCNPPLFSESLKEIELLDFIKSIYHGEIIHHDRKIGDGKEIDIFLPDLRIGFEFDGIYWHSEIFKGKNGNIDKKDFLENKGIKIYNIWEDLWCYKQEIIKSRIENIFNLSNRIYARECTITEIRSRDERKFLDTNHIQGYVPSKIKIGLYHHEILIALMTLGSKRKALGQIGKEGEFELLRYCNKLGYTIIGGASRAFTYFIKKYSPSSIISYQDNSWHAGNLYKNLGFNFIEKSKPNYFWCKRNIRLHRYNFRKDKLIKEGYDPNKTEDQIMTERGYYKLWDFGNLKWEYIKKGLDIF